MNYCVYVELEVLKKQRDEARAQLAAAQARIAELERELAGRPAPLVWTSEPPEVEGLYLHHDSAGFMSMAWIGPESIKHMRRPGTGSKWCGPIPEPTEPTHTDTPGHVARVDRPGP